MPGERLCAVASGFRALDKYVESEFDLSSGLWFSRALDKYAESEFDLSRGLGQLGKHPQKGSDCGATYSAVCFLIINTLPPISQRSARNGISAEAPCISIFDAGLPVCHVGRHQSECDGIEEESENAKSPKLRGIEFAIVADVLHRGRW